MTGRITRAAGAAQPLRPEIGVELVPGVAHRRQAVAEVRTRAGCTTDLAQQWLMLTTRSKRSKRNCSIAVGKSGR